MPKRVIFFVSKLGPRGFKIMQRGFVDIHMTDGSVFYGQLEPLVNGGTVDWLEPTTNLRRQLYQSAFIETEKEAHNQLCSAFYWVRIIYKSSTHHSILEVPEVTQGPEVPKYAMIRIDDHRRNQYFAAEDFQLYDRQKYHSRIAPDRPPINHIFVASAGYVYFSPITGVDYVRPEY